MEFKVGRGRVFAATGGQPFDPDQPAVVFIHGAGNDHTVWHGPARYFAYHGRSVLAFDLPGHGRSGGKALATIEGMASWLVRAIDAIGQPADRNLQHDPARDQSGDQLHRVIFLETDVKAVDRQQTE